MEANYWTRRRDATRHGFIGVAGRDENYWTRHPHRASPARVAAAGARKQRLSVGPR